MDRFWEMFVLACVFLYVALILLAFLPTQVEKPRRVSFVTCKYVGGTVIATKWGRVSCAA